MKEDEEEAEEDEKDKEENNEVVNRSGLCLERTELSECLSP